MNVSVASVHYYTHPAAAARPGGTLSKTAAATMFQLLAMENKQDELQVVTYHPGLLWNEYFESLGLPKDKFDSRMFIAVHLHVRRVILILIQVSLPLLLLSGQRQRRPHSCTAVSFGLHGMLKSLLVVKFEEELMRILISSGRPSRH